MCGGLNVQLTAWGQGQKEYVESKLPAMSPWVAVQAPPAFPRHSGDHCIDGW